MKNPRRLLRIFLSLSILSTVFISSIAWSHSTSKKDLGLGIVIGEPTGLSARYWMDSRSALDFALAYSFDDYIITHGDYKWNFDNFIPKLKQHVHPYAGIGAALGIVGSDNSHFDNDGRIVLTMRIPFGFEWMIGKSPFGVFLELAPTLGLMPETFFDLGGGIGARYFF